MPLSKCSKTRSRRPSYSCCVTFTSILCFVFVLVLCCSTIAEANLDVNENGGSSNNAKYSRSLTALMNPDSPRKLNKGRLFSEPHDVSFSFELAPKKGHGLLNFLTGFPIFSVIWFCIKQVIRWNLKSILWLLNLVTFFARMFFLQFSILFDFAGISRLHKDYDSVSSIPSLDYDFHDWTL